MSQKPVVSICCITYNHAAFIGQSLEGFVSQVTDFPFEAIVHDDASTDGTADIIRDYAERYPAIIKPIFQTENQYRKERGRVTRTVFQAATGRYVAMCEGDDYWTDPMKLQKQIDFLEAYPEFAFCAHKVKEWNGFDLTKERFIPAIDTDTVYTIEDFVRSNLVATCSVVFRKDALIPIPNFFQRLPYGDLAISLIVLHRSNGKAMVLADEMGVYRIHAGGVHGSMHSSPSKLIGAYEQHLMFMEIIAKELLNDGSYDEAIRSKIARTKAHIAELRRQLPVQRSAWRRAGSALKRVLGRLIHRTA